MNFAWKNSLPPTGVLRIKQSLSHQSFMANSPHSEQGHIVPHIYIPRMIKGEKWSLPTVNISKCLAESQFCVIQTIFPDAFITYSEIWNSWCDIHRLCVSWALRLRRNLSVSWCLGGGTRGNSCLGRRFLWASRSGHIHAARREARWDRPPIYCVSVCCWQLHSGDIWLKHKTNTPRRFSRVSMWSSE